mmetsp:Transcript_22726/g.36220  ORF Transcript_22726/g.36220 Transcript_22726/m.36220 type:complete len:342 (+) Transcript_22726:3207-4232(+)
MRSGARYKAVFHCSGLVDHIIGFAIREICDYYCLCVVSKSWRLIVEDVVDWKGIYELKWGGKNGIVLPATWIAPSSLDWKCRVRAQHGLTGPPGNMEDDAEIYSRHFQKGIAHLKTYALDSEECTRVVNLLMDAIFNGRFTCVTHRQRRCPYQDPRLKVIVDKYKSGKKPSLDELEDFRLVGYGNSYYYCFWSRDGVMFSCNIAVYAMWENFIGFRNSDPTGSDWGVRRLSEIDKYYVDLCVVIGATTFWAYSGFFGDDSMTQLLNSIYSNSVQRGGKLLYCAGCGRRPPRIPYISCENVYYCTSECQTLDVARYLQVGDNVVDVPTRNLDGTQALIRCIL